MSIPDILKTKLYISPIRPDLVPRPRLVERLNAGLQRKLTLISAPAGFGKTTLASEWVDDLHNGRSGNQADFQIAWLSLDEGDNDPIRFLTYFIGALSQVEGLEPPLGEGAMGMLHSPQPPPTETLLTSLLNELTTIPGLMILILDDYHLIESATIDEALVFILEHLPPQLHLVIMTRVDPQLPISRMRACNQLTELRGSDLRFTSAEAADFLNHTMGLDLSAGDIRALDTRTEGWIAGLQLAAISMQGLEDPAGFIRSFTASHQFVLNYLIEEVLEQRPEGTKDFLMKTSILDRFTGSLCDAVMGWEGSQEIIDMLNNANLFIIPLDNERHWYRYHHLFCDLLRQRFHQISASSTGDARKNLTDLHIRASEWYEKNDLEIEAFLHAVAANDVEHAERLMEGGGMPLPVRGALSPVLNWLESLPTTILDARPSLWVTYAATLLATGQATDVEAKLKAAEAALQGVEPDDKTRDIVGRIAATRATLAWGRDNVEAIIAQSRRALEYLHPENVSFRTSTAWKLASAYQLQGDRDAARKSYSEAVAICEASGNTFINILASTGLGDVQASANQLDLAAQTYLRVLQLVGDQPLSVACGAHLGLARIFYEWDDLEAAQQHGEESVRLARHIDGNDAFAECGVILSRLKLAQGDVPGAAAVLAKADEFVREHNFVHAIPSVAAAQAQTLLRQGNLDAAADLAEQHELPIIQARVLLANGNPSAALSALEPLRRQVDERDWKDEWLRVLVLQAVALQAHGESAKAVRLLGDALALAEPGGFIRIFVDEGPTMAGLLRRVNVESASLKGYIRKILAAFDKSCPHSSSPQPLFEPLSDRELDVLQLIADGLTNQEIASRLYLSLNTVKVHTRNIYGKLDVNNRTRAVARARELGVLPSS